MNDLHCLIIGRDSQLGGDLTLNPTHAGATVERFSDLAEAAESHQIGATCLWLILPDQHVPALAEFGHWPEAAQIFPPASWC